MASSTAWRKRGVNSRSTPTCRHPGNRRAAASAASQDSGGTPARTRSGSPRRLVWAATLVLAAAGCGQDGPKDNVNYGRISSLDLLGKEGTLTILHSTHKDEPKTPIVFKITPETKFQRPGRRDREPTEIPADKLAETFKKDSMVRVSYEESGGDLIAKTVQPSFGGFRGSFRGGPPDRGGRPDRGARPDRGGRRGRRGGDGQPEKP